MDDKLESIAEGDDPGNDPYPLRTVVIHRGDKGYGLTVSGESPVIVQDVKDGGPAAQAGVQKGDSIIKVNGTLVSQVNHKEVVQIIKSTQYVALTLKSLGEDEVSLSSPQDAPHRPLPPTPTSSKSNDRITAPLPVNMQLQNQFDVNKCKMLQMFLEKQRRARELIIVELQKGPSTKVLQKNLEKELESVNRQIMKIQEEIKSMKDIEASQFHSHGRSSPRSPPSSRSHHPLISHQSQHGSHHSHTRSQSEIPPPLPARNRSLITQISAPNISCSSLSLTSTSPSSTTFAAAPPLPPRPPFQLERVGEGGLAQSLENIHKVPVLTHSASSVSDSGYNIGRPQSHYRAKSSPDPLGLQGSPGSVRLSGSDSAMDLSASFISGRNKSLTGLSGDDNEPPGTPPPPYMSQQNLGPSTDDNDDNYEKIEDNVDTGVGFFPSQPILSMEDEEFSDPEPLEDHGPFQSLSKLWNHNANAYLAVFMNYVISNCDSSCLFFYMITDLYKEGGVKEMKRWAYEIHSSFLLPGAPLRLSSIEDSILHEIDETLQNELDKEEILRKVFWKARQKCREDLNEQLADFRAKRSAGLGSIFGPRDHTLEESIHNKQKELQIVEHLLVPCLESVSEDLKNATDQMFLTASCLATILQKYYGVKSQQSLQLIDRCPLFVSKESRPLRSKFFRGSKKFTSRDHVFNQHAYFSVTYCNHCGLIIWGITPQGYQCANCEMNIHKSCVKLVEETCIGQLHKKESRGRDGRLSSFLTKIIPDDKENRRKPSNVNPAHIADARRRYEESGSEALGLMSETTDGISVEKGLVAGTPGNSSASCLSKEQRRSDPGSSSSLLANHTPQNAVAGSTGTSAANTSTSSLHNNNNNNSQTEGLTNNGPDVGEDHAADPSSPQLSNADNHAPFGASKPNSNKKNKSQINRSESCREKQPNRKRTRENRKHSDPNIPTSKSGDVDTESGLNYTNSGSSSNSSLSQSPENSQSLPVDPEDFPQFPRTELPNDSDVEAELDLPNWSDQVPKDQFKRLKPKERKRQDTINELFHTERTHVRVLKVLKSLFCDPMCHGGKLIPDDLLEILFPNMEQILETHKTFNQAMKRRRKEGDNHLIQRVGDLLVDMFDGESGENFRQTASEFVRYQSIALERLKQLQKTDARLQNFLREQENNPHCRRLQLKDMLPCGFQRLTKYPLLMESLLSQTDSNKQPEEHEQISRALNRAKDILEYVNAAVKEAENNQRLSEIQKRLDQSSLTKNRHGVPDELRGNLDLTRHKLIYEGQLTWRISKGQKNVDLHVLLLEEFIVLLQKQDDKYLLKNHAINKSLGKDENKLTHSPIIKYGPSMLFRAVATDKCAFFIVTTQAVGAQIYELVTISANERKVWFRHIQEAQEAYSARDGRNRRSHPQRHPGSDDDPPDPLGGDNEIVEGEVANGDSGIDSSLPPTPQSVKVDDSSKQDESSIGSPTSNSTLTSTLQPPGSPETVSNKTAEVGGAALGSSSSGLSSMGSSSPASGRRLQEVQIIQIVEGPTLIQPHEVKVSQGVVLSAQPVLTPIEHLRRKDLKIRQALEEKQHIIADILNIPAEHFENVADMAGEPAVGNKEPRELVLAAMYQAKCLQESLNEALNIRESDVVAARANNENPSSKTHLPLYQAPMTKLMNISTSLSSQLTSLLNLISERDDERERMRKELVASRERLHLFHMKQNSLSSSSQMANPTFSGVPGTPPSATSPHTSRPNSFISVTSSAADHSDTPEHHDTDEESRGDVAKRNSHNEEETEESKEDSVIETFEDAVSASEAVERTSAVEQSDKSIVDGETIGNAISEADTT